MKNAGDELTQVYCADCGEDMNRRQLRNYLAWGEIQVLDEEKTGLCANCRWDRFAEGESPEDLLAEFCE